MLFSAVAQNEVRHLVDAVFALGIDAGVVKGRNEALLVCSTLLPEILVHAQIIKEIEKNLGLRYHLKRSLAKAEGTS